MTHQTDDRGRILRTWDDDGKLIYAARANWGLEADVRLRRIPHRFGIYYSTGILRDIREGRVKGA